VLWLSFWLLFQASAMNSTVKAYGAMNKQVNAKHYHFSGTERNIPTFPCPIPI